VCVKNLFFKTDHNLAHLTDHLLEKLLLNQNNRYTILLHAGWTLTFKFFVFCQATTSFYIALRNYEKGLTFDIQSCNEATQFIYFKQISSDEAIVSLQVAMKRRNSFPLNRFQEMKRICRFLGPPKVGMKRLCRFQKRMKRSQSEVGRSVSVSEDQTIGTSPTF